MDAHDLDLNLLRTLDVLLAERSVTRAAAILHRSQPAVSHALARLRDALGDPLLVRQGRELVPTPRALALAGPVRRLLAELRRSLVGADFDPETDRRTFVIASPDVLAPAIPLVLAALRDAPRVQVELSTARGPAALAHADLLIDVLPDDAPGTVARRLGFVHQAVIARRGHPAIERWDLDAWCASPHILVRTPDAAPSPIERALAAVGRERSVGLILGNLLSAPHVVAATDLLFNGPREILALIAEPLGLVLLEPPIPLPRVPVAAMWEERNQADPGHRWLRERVCGALGGLLGAAAGATQADRPDPFPPAGGPGEA